MIPENMKEMANPYFPITSNLGPHEFIGREDEIRKLQSIMDEYQKTSNLKNMIISGEKSIGKSSLINRYKQILQYHNFVVFEVELPRDPSIEVDEFEFFKDLIDELFEKYAPPESGFFDEEQSEIWFSLTRDDYCHDSDFQGRKIAFASQYASRKKGTNEKLSYKKIEKDFEKIMDEIVSKEMEIDGLAILIDEFQELSKNVLILDILRQLSEKLPGLMVIGAGLPTFLDNPIFEKFSRSSESVNLRSMERNEILDLIFKPLEGRGLHSRYVVKQWFDSKSIYEIAERSGGNPLHVKILSAKMFDHYQKNPSLGRMELNKFVMEEVMEYYSTISEKSRRIRLSFETCSRDQLNAFSLLYRYEGFSIRAAILLELAFKPIVPEEEVVVRDRLMEAFKDIWDLNLFELKEKNMSLQDIEDLKTDSLAHIEYKFIGDAIDKLYASYNYEELTDKRLLHNNNMSFEDLLALELAGSFYSILTRKKIHEIVVPNSEPLIKIRSGRSGEESYAKNVINDLDRLVEKTRDEAEDDETREVVYEISKKHDLDFPAHLASMLEFDGYYMVIADVNIKGKAKLIYDLFPVKARIDEILEIREQVKDISVNTSCLDQYIIRINSIYIYWLPKQPLLKITYMNIDSEMEALFESVAKREFDPAIEIASRIRTLNIKFGERKIAEHVNTVNNYGFCLINVNSLDEAMDELQRCQDKFLISRVNLAYTLYARNDYEEATKILNRIIRKHLGKDEQSRFLHLTINHPKLPMKNRLVENSLIYQVAAWNLALIYCQQKRDRGIINSFLKKVKPKKNESLVDRRVRNWIDYYSGKAGEALEKARKLLNDCEKVEYLHKDVSKDVEIFQSEMSVYV